MTSVLFKDQNEREKVEIELNKNKVETRPLFYPIDELPYYNSNKECLIAKNVYRRGLTLPSFPSITDKQLSLIINIIKKNV
jgi:perosamine synthetase